MKIPFSTHVLAATILLGSLPVHVPNSAAADATARVAVDFVDPEKFTDMRYSEAERYSPVIKGIYPPRIALEFRAVDVAGQAVTEGKRDLTDIDYQMRVVYPPDDYLRYEKDLLRDWLLAELASLKIGKTH